MGEAGEASGRRVLAAAGAKQGEAGQSGAMPTSSTSLLATLAKEALPRFLLVLKALRSGRAALALGASTARSPAAAPGGGGGGERQGRSWQEAGPAVAMDPPQRLPCAPH